MSAMQLMLRSQELKGGLVPNGYRTAGMLAIFSVFLLVEGTVRLTLVTARNHELDWGGEGGGRFPGALLLLGAVIEFAAGLTGLLRALAVIAFDHGNPRATAACAVSALASSFTFVVFVFAEPVYNARTADASPVFGLTLPQYRAVVGFGVLGGAAYSGALFFGQLFFAWHLYNAETGGKEKHTPGYCLGHLLCYSTLALLAGISHLAVGVFVRDEVGSARLRGAERVEAPPFFVVYPELNIATGLMLTFAATVGLGRAVFRSPSGRWAFGMLWALTWIIQVVAMAVVQLGMWTRGAEEEREARVFASGTLVVGTLALSILPPFTDALANSEEETATVNA